MSFHVKKYHYIFPVIKAMITNNKIRAIDIVANKNIPNRINLLFLSKGTADIEKATIKSPVQLVNNHTAPVILL
jgi:hypothetical protein